MKISDIIYEGEYVFSDIDRNVEFSDLTVDPENVKDGSILIIPNSKRYIKKSYLNSPIAVICDEEANIADNIPTIRTKNPRLAMANAFYRYYNPDLSKTTLIGITGTNGKSGTGLFIEKILSDNRYKVGFIGTGMVKIAGKTISESNYSMTTPDPAYLYKIIKRMTDENCTAIIMEVSSHSLALDKTTPLYFNYAVFTNLSSEHMDFHGDIENYFMSKSKLFDRCKTAVFNIDDKYARRLNENYSRRKITAGILWKGDVYASKVESRGFQGTRYLYHGKDFLFRMTLNLPGVYNVYNSMLASAVCIDMGCKPCNVKKSVSNITNIPGRFEIIKDKITVIIDYAHTEAAFNNIMKEICECKGKSKVTAVFGCGGERDREKRPKMAVAAENYADKIIITTDNSRGENPKDIISDIIRGFTKKGYEVNENRAEAITNAILTAEDNDIVAIIGKGCERYNIDSQGYHYFNEKEIVKSALEQRKKAKNLCE